jgi:hypothetical protein
MLQESFCLSYLFFSSCGGKDSHPDEKRHLDTLNFEG